MQIPSIFLTTSIKGIFMIGGIYFAAGRLKKLSSRYKHLLWLFVICILPVLPVFQFAAQSFDIGVIKLRGGNEDTPSKVAGLFFPEWGPSDQAAVSDTPGSADTQNKSDTKTVVLTANSAPMALKTGVAVFQIATRAPYNWSHSTRQGIYKSH